MGNFFTELLDKILEKLRGLVPGVVSISDVDLTAELDKLAEGTGLDWKSSVVDFLKLIGADSSRAGRAALAVELGVEGDAGKPETNEALRVAVFKKIAENGGNIPPSLLD